MKAFFKHCLNVLVFLIIVSCNNRKVDKVNEGDQDIRVEGYEKKTASDNAYPNNAVGEYLEYISEEEGKSNISYEKSLQLLAAAVIEINRKANISSHSELKRLANIDLSEEYLISRKDLTTITKALQNGVEKGSFKGGEEIEKLNSSAGEISINENIEGNEMKEFFEDAAELLEGMNVKGSSK